VGFAGHLLSLCVRPACPAGSARHDVLRVVIDPLLVLYDLALLLQVVERGSERVRTVAVGRGDVQNDLGAWQAHLAAGQEAEDRLGRRDLGVFAKIIAGNS